MTYPAPTFDAAWPIYRDGGMPLADAFDLAFGIACIDGVWSLNANPEGALAAMYALEDDIFELRQACNHEAWFARIGAYGRIREALEAIYPDAHCASTDPWSYETYAELYKDDYGSRPSGQVTGPEVRRWIARRDAS